MFRPSTDGTFKAIVFTILLSTPLLADGCSKREQPISTGSTPSAFSSLEKVVKSAVQGGGEFEGIIAMRMDAEKQKGMEMTYFIKHQRSRMEMKLPGAPEGQGVMLWDLEAGKMTTLIPAMKSYMTMDLKEMAEGLKGMGGKSKNEKDETKFPKLTPTGKEETIAGYTCEHWLMGDKQDMDICVAKGLGYFGMGSQIGGGFAAAKSLFFNPKLLAQAAAHPEWVSFLKGGAFPLKLTMMEDGKPKMAMEATRIERKSLEDSLFTVPPGYKEINLGGLMGGKH